MRTKFTKTLPPFPSIAGGFSQLEPSVTVARTLLSEIELFLAGKEKPPGGAKQVHVEHIFPQSPSSHWRSSFGVKRDEEESYVARLGNLTLLDERLNKQASNKLYEDKRTAYYSKSDFRITNQLPKGASWTVESVKLRQTELFEIAKKIWAIE